MGLFGGGAKEDERDILISKLKSDIEDLDKRLQSSEDTIRQYQIDIRSYESENDNLKSQILTQIKKNERLQDEIVHLNETLRGADRRLEAARNAQSTSDAEELRNVIAELNKDIADKIKQIDALEQENASLRDVNSKLSAAQKSGDSSAQIKSLKESNDKAREFLTRAKELVLEYQNKEKTWESEKELARNAIIELKSKVSDLQSKLDAATSGSSDSQAKIDALTSEVASLKTERDSLKVELDGLKAKLGALLG